MLPIRLGMLNADGAQELFVFTLTRTGRVETANYPTVSMPTNVEVPVFVKDEFDDFFRSAFTKTAAENPGTAILEYAWDMNWCDPCAADPLSKAELTKLGAWWLDQALPLRKRRAIQRQLQPVDVYVTRLHLRYTAETHPEDLMFKETGNRENFQGRYILRHPWTGDDVCEAADAYRISLIDRWEKESQSLAQLTGWSNEAIRAKQPKLAPLPPPRPWWEQMWKK